MLTPGGYFIEGLAWGGDACIECTARQRGCPEYDSSVSKYEPPKEAPGDDRVSPGILSLIRPSPVQSAEASSDPKG